MAMKSTAAVTEIQKAPPGVIRSLLLNDGQPTFLLGAGASKTSGIPTADEAVERAARWAWCHENGRSKGDLRIVRSDYWPWLCQQTWFDESRPLAEQYPLVMGKLLGVKKTRRDFFERLISPAVAPSVGYRKLALLLNEGWISTVLTTNFDQCLDAARVIENKPHLLVSIKTPDDLIRLSSSPSDPQLIYLHGSVEHYSDKNLDEEIAALDPRLLKKLEPLLTDHPLVVVGYRGAEPSIMTSLLHDAIDVTNRFAQGVYWCVREAEIDAPLTPLLSAFAKSIGTNFQLVPIKGFDELLERDLWNQIKEAGVSPRRRSGFRPIETPRDMKEVPDSAITELDANTLFSRLTQYAKRLGLRPPDTFDQGWLESQSRNRNLVTGDGEKSKPTLAGWLLFARSPSTRTPKAVVKFQAKGPPEWVKRCLGEDVITSAADAEGNAVVVEQEVSGSLWAQLDALNDLLALINQGFRLKEEQSRTVYPFAPLAIKEVLVNALVHRDYDSQEPVSVSVEPTQIVVVNPGGLVAEVKAQTEGKDLEDLIAEGMRGIKGYRNPVISDLFYGGGQMDRAGSGLSDVLKTTANNNGRVHFGPENGNTQFKVVIYARPEQPDETTNTAIPASQDSTRYAANLLPIEQMPKFVWHAGTTAKSTRALYKDASELVIPSGYVHDGRFFTLYDLETIVEASVTPFEIGDVERLALSEVMGLPNGENIVHKLMNDAVSEHLRALGLWVEYDRRRAYFPKSAEGELKITYRGRVKRATRTVVKERKRGGTGEVLYYEHKAFMFSVVRFGVDWAITIAPAYAFTRDGEKKPIGRDRINVLSTRRAARDFNPSVHHDVTFWAATLSEEANGIFALKVRPHRQPECAPAILLSSRLPTVTFNASSYAAAQRDSDDVDEELIELDAEIAALAEEEEVEDEQQEGDTDAD